MAFVIKSVLETAPEKRTRGTGKGDVDYSQELELINAIPSGKHVEIEFPDLKDFRAFSAKLRAAGRTVNKTVETFIHRKGVYVSWIDGVTPRAPRGSKKAAALAAAEAAANGETPSESEQPVSTSQNRRNRERELQPA